MMVDELTPRATASPDRDAVAIDVFRSHYRSLVGMARLFVEDEAEEVVQESFVGLCARLRRIGDPDDALAYLRAAVLNRCRSRLRRRRTARTRAHLVERPTTVHQRDDRLHDPDIALVRQAIRELPRRQQQCIVLRHYEGCGDAEIASTLGISIGSVKQHLHRAAAHLTDRLEDLA